MESDSPPVIQFRKYFEKLLRIDASIEEKLYLLIVIIVESNCSWMCPHLTATFEIIDELYPVKKQVKNMQSIDAYGGCLAYPRTINEALALYESGIRKKIVAILIGSSLGRTLLQSKIKLQAV